jgi:hypothetical protein
MKTKYKYVHFHQATPEIWLGHENGFDTMVATITKQDHQREWYAVTTETGGMIPQIRRLINYLRDITHFLEQLNAEGKT